MTDLSPAAQKVLDAYAKRINDSPLLLEREALAAALRALADQMVPHLEEPDWGTCDGIHRDIDLYTDHMRKRSEILFIAAELEGGR